MKRPRKIYQNDLVTTRYTLLSRLQNWQDDRSWADFFETYWRLIYSLAIRAGLTETEAQDVVQETVIRVAKDIGKFELDRSRGSFKGWLRNLTRWRIADQLRKRQLGPGKHDVDHALDEVPEPVSQTVNTYWEAEWEANLMEAALERVKKRIREEHFQIFDLYVVKNWTAPQVARRLGVSISQIYVTKYRISLLIKREMQSLQNRY